MKLTANIEVTIDLPTPPLPLTTPIRVQISKIPNTLNPFVLFFDIKIIPIIDKITLIKHKIIIIKNNITMKNTSLLALPSLN